MFKFLAEESNTNVTSIVIYVVLILALVAMLILPYFTQRKKNREYMEMIGSLKVGDLVKTAGGIIGKITKIIDKGEIKTVILETGSKAQKSYMEFDMAMIYCVLKSTKTEQKEEKEVEEPTEMTEVVDEEKTEEPKKKAPAKRATAKKTTTKKTNK